jgi:hypothetical protein
VTLIGVRALYGPEVPGAREEKAPSPDPLNYKGGGGITNNIAQIRMPKVPLTEEYECASNLKAVHILKMYAHSCLPTVGGRPSGGCT